MNRIGIVGANGRVGNLMVAKGCIPLDCDIRDTKSIEKAIAQEDLSVIASFAGKSSPEWCQKKENLQEMLDVNARGVANLGDVTQKLNIPVVILSTDHVFSGRSYFDWTVKRWIKSGPYTEDYIRTVPVNRYGVSKLAGEHVATTPSISDHMKIVRTSYLFDTARLSDDIYRITANHQNTKSYPTFIHRSFMHTEHFVESFLYYLEHIEKMPKILHISGSQTVSWATFMASCIETRVSTGRLLTHRKDNEELCPRPHKAGLVTALSAELGLPQFNYLDGLKLVD